MSKSKEKPLDRYPYMENNLKGWDNYFVTTETYSTGFNYLNKKIDDIIDDGFVTHEEFDTYKTFVGETYATKAWGNEVEVRLTELETIWEYLDNYVTDTEFNTYKTTTYNTLIDLQNQINDIDVSNYVTTTDFNTYTTTTDATLTSLQEQIDAIEIPTDYVTTSEFNTYKTATDTRLDTIEADIDDIPNSYTTKTEFNGYVSATATTLNNLETNKVNVSDFNTYTTTTATTLTSLQNQIDTKAATNDVTLRLGRCYNTAFGAWLVERLPTSGMTATGTLSRPTDFTLPQSNASTRGWIAFRGDSSIALFFYGMASQFVSLIAHYNITTNTWTTPTPVLTESTKGISPVYEITDTTKFWSNVTSNITINKTTIQTQYGRVYLKIDGTLNTDLTNTGTGALMNIGSIITTNPCCPTNTFDWTGKFKRAQIMNTWGNAYISTSATTVNVNVYNNTSSTIPSGTAISIMFEYIGINSDNLQTVATAFN